MGLLASLSVLLLVSLLKSRPGLASRSRSRNGACSIPAPDFQHPAAATIRSMIQFVLEADRELLEGAFRFAQKQVRRLIEHHPDLYPLYTVNGRWKHEGATWTHWCDGFLPGMMWIFGRRLPDANGDKKYWIEQAIRYTTPL